MTFGLVILSETKNPKAEILRVAQDDICSVILSKTRNSKAEILRVAQDDICTCHSE